MLKFFLEREGVGGGGGELFSLASQLPTYLPHIPPIFISPHILRSSSIQESSLLKAGKVSFQVFKMKNFINWEIMSFY